MVKAGPPVDAVLQELLPHLDAGDLVIDGGNSHFRDTERRGEWACPERVVVRRPGYQRRRVRLRPGPGRDRPHLDGALHHPGGPAGRRPGHLPASSPLPNLLLDPGIARGVADRLDALRGVVEQAQRWGIPVPAFSAVLAYLDGYRSPRLPSNLVQAQRDYFGAHTYQRTDRPGLLPHGVVQAEEGERGQRPSPARTVKLVVNTP